MVRDVRCDELARQETRAVWGRRLEEEKRERKKEREGWMDPVEELGAEMRCSGLWEAGVGRVRVRLEGTAYLGTR